MALPVIGLRVADVSLIEGGLRVADLTIIEEGPDGALIERPATPDEASRWTYRHHVRYASPPLFQHFYPPAPRRRRLRLRAWVTWALMLRRVARVVWLFVCEWWSLRP